LFANRPRWLIRSKMVELARSILSGDLEEAFLYYLSACPQRAVNDEQLSCFLTDMDRESCFESLTAAGSISRVSGFYMSQSNQSKIESSLVAALNYRDGGTEKGIVAETSPGYQLSSSELERLRFKILPGVDRTVFQKLVDGLVESGAVEKHGDKLSLPGAVSSELDPQLKKLSDRLNAWLLNLDVIEIDKLADELDSSSQDVKAALEVLSDQNRAYIVNYDFACSREVIEKAHKVLDDIWKQGREISPSEFKSPLGISRKYAMALLAYFDDTQVTRRGSGGRILLRPLH